LVLIPDDDDDDEEEEEDEEEEDPLGIGTCRNVQCDMVI
jgi:hypothetical protein